MDGVGMLLGLLTALCFLVILWLNFRSGAAEGFLADASDASGATVNATATQVRTVMGRLSAEEKDLCTLFNTIRTTAFKNAKAGTSISDEEARQRVEKDLAIKIPGGALTCPLLVYPKDTSTDLDWLDWLTKIPDDFGARVVFMAIYAKEYLGKTAQDLKDALGGTAVPGSSEGFLAVCPPDVTATRRAEAAKKGQAPCALPEDMSPEEVKEAITQRLKALVAAKDSALKAKSIDPGIDILPLIKDANASAAYLAKSSQQAEAGTLPISATV